MHAETEAVHRSTTSPTKSLTTISLLRDMLATGHPIRALYRGLAPNLLGNASSWASFFFFKSRAELAITTFKSGSDAVPGKVLTPTDFFLSSLAAGAATQCITNPIWVLKTRIVSSDRNAAGAYPGMIAGVKHIIQTEGLRGFYRGLGVGLMGVSHGAVQFAVYEPAKRVYFRRKRDWTGDTGLQPDAKDAKITNDATVVLSTLSKFVAGTVTYPLQVLRARLQNYHAEERFGRGIRGVVRQLWREEGFRGFYRGTMPGVVRVLPATWVTFLVYENVKFYLPIWVG
ncbi:hypothetical protein DL546_005060 [Coniochaeta pulveracea]|uniref:Uncharacterized protein n=1 Tax=Coniochaeta pulveracea TaxID=177199 RepID=A0A420YBC3_9PEZI|nr:hypothetical protein DL546_005060 [Coniochaeta pulveracea]